MPATLTATLDRPTLLSLFEQLTPLRVRLDDGDAGRFLWVDRPDLLEFVPGAGVRLRTRARLQWTLAGIAIPAVTLQSATFRLEPWLSPPPHKGRLNFRLRLEEIDLKNLPGLLDQQIVLRANQFLGALGDLLGWSFGETLAARLQLPERFEPVEAFALEAGTATVDVLGDALKLTLPLPMRFALRSGP